MGAAIACAFLLMWKAADLQLSNGQELQQRANANTIVESKTLPHRGMISDRNGEVLAISAPAKSVIGDPSVLVNYPHQWPRLATLLETTESHLETLLVPRRQRRFLYLRRQVQPELAMKVAASGIKGLWLQDEYRRYYPTAEVTAHLLGFTNVDEKGQEGIELAFNDTLAGHAGKVRLLRDRHGRVVEEIERLRAVEPGHDLSLSLDRRVQYVAYRELKEAVQRHGARAGFVVILDVETGEVVALVNQPSFNPNNRRDLKGENYRNRAITDPFEPGSTIKPFTIAAALEAEICTPRTLIDTAPGFFKVGHHTVRDMHNYGRLTVAQILEKSSNVGVSKIALSMDAEQMWRIFDRVGLGHNTGVGLPIERTGRLDLPADWRAIEQATLAFGYRLSVTGLQLARAYAVLASGGILRPATVLKQNTAIRGERVLRAEVVAAVNRMLRKVVSDGTASAAAVPGYQVAGKTGTVHKYRTGQGYAADEYLSIFAGFIPATAPKLVAVVIIDGPRRGQHFGGQVAAPVFGQVMHDVARIMNLSPDAYPDTSVDVRLASGAPSAGNY